MHLLLKANRLSAPLVLRFHKALNAETVVWVGSGSVGLKPPVNLFLFGENINSRGVPKWQVCGSSAEVCFCFRKFQKANRSQARSPLYSSPASPWSHHLSLSTCWAIDARVQDKCNKQRKRRNKERERDEKKWREGEREGERERHGMRCSMRGAAVSDFDSSWCVSRKQLQEHNGHTGQNK